MDSWSFEIELEGQGCCGHWPILPVCEALPVVNATIRIEGRVAVCKNLCVEHARRLGWDGSVN